MLNVAGAAKTVQVTGENYSDFHPAGPGGAAADPIAGKYYWAGTQAILRANPDGTNVEVVLSASGVKKLHLDVGEHALFFISAGGGGLSKMNMDGGASETIASGGIIYDFALDRDSDQIYFTIGDQIRRVNYDGSGSVTVVPSVAATVRFDAMFLDLSLGHIYAVKVLSGGVSGMYRFNLDGSGETWAPLVPTNNVTFDAIERAVYFVAMTSNTEGTFNSVYKLSLPGEGGSVSFVAAVPVTTSVTIAGFLQSVVDCNANGIPDACDTALVDCNSDGIPDDCQLAGNDCNADGIPDDCQLAANDCNSNGIPDDCELFNNDCNGNGVPDACEISGGQFTHGDEPNLAIPDADPVGIQSVISVPATGAISDVDVNLHIVHSWQGDVIATLSHNGTSVTLIRNSGGSSVGCTTNAFGYQSNNFGSAANPLVLDDSAPVSIDCYDGSADTIAIDDYAGPAMPHEPLAAFNGMDVSGDWVLTVSAPLVQETGTLVSWSIDVETSGADCNANGRLDACDIGSSLLYAMSDASDEIIILDDDGAATGPSIALPASSYRGIAVDRGLGKIYYSSTSTDQLFRANLDGTGTEVLVDAPSGRAITIEIDAADDRIYWLSGFTVWRAFRDGTGVESVISSDPDFGSITGLALDTVNGRLYLTGQTGDQIWSANLDGSDLQPIIDTGINSPVEIDVDPIGGRVYFTQGDGFVRRANTDGANLETIYSGGSTCTGIVLDLNAGKVYFSDTGTDQLLRCNLDGSALEVIAGVDNAFRFARDSASRDCNANSIPDECETEPLGCGPGEECDVATPVTEGTTFGTLEDNRGDSGDDDSCGGVNSTIDEWLAFTPAVSTLATISTCNPGTEFDSVIAIFDACPQNGGVQLACNDDTSGAPTECSLSGFNRKSTVRLDVVAGQTYLIRLSVFNDNILGTGGFGPNYELSIDLCSKGDLNADDVVDPFDVPLFVDALLDPAAATPETACGADMNGDGQLDGADTQLFTNALLVP